ncbi:2-C-methyl-D-erythritol 4-phosphate cytidylyltransferase [Clostridium sp. AM58-1XD]|uniref:IspD/TarI family cytidylyltransferase n=1 Tax=Clostridium sp. AM58-1XD TaxID=2292307 RepID=UPI00325AD712
MENRRKRTAAIVLAAGQGKRMQSSIQKQYMLLQGNPLIYYALKEFESSGVDDIILVAGKGEMEYCREEITDRYGFCKIRRVVEGGRERYHSVYEGLKAVGELNEEIGQCGTVLIHDGARPFITPEIIRSCIEGACEFKACVVGMPVKDTIKVADEEGFAKETPKRSSLCRFRRRRHLITN